MRSSYRKKWDNLNLFIEAKYRKHAYITKGKLRLKRMNGGYRCDKEYKDVVLPYWKKYGYKPRKMWYQIFCDTEKKIDPRFIPDDLWYGELVPYFSNSQFRRFGEDKCYHDLWFADLKRPATLVKNIAGVYYDKSNEVITEEKAIEICLTANGEYLIKPSIDSGEGRLIRFFVPSEKTKVDIEELFRDMGANFIIQDVVKQHPNIAKFNQSSLNTIRIVSFFFEGKVHILSSILRVGAPGSRVDNVGAGGYACPIMEDGHLMERGVNRKSEWILSTDDGVYFKGIEVPAYKKVIEIIENKHKQLPHFKLIGWDFAIDENDEPVFIEFNSCPGQNQVTCGPTFGDITERVLEEYFICKTLEKSQN